MRLLVFFLILTCFASVWAAYGISELAAFSSGAIISMLAAALVSYDDLEE